MCLFPERFRSTGRMPALAGGAGPTADRKVAGLEFFMNSSPIDLAQLRTFVAVAEEKHLTRAAERIHVSQSAASAHVRAIEARLEIQLFTRQNRRLELTGAGELLLRKARVLLNKAILFDAFARELRGEMQGSLVIGVSGDPASSRIGEIIAVLRRKHPLIHLHMDARPSSGVRQGLKSGELDVGLLLDNPTDVSFRYHELKTVRFRIGGPIAWKSQIENASSLAALASLPWISPSYSSMAYAIVQDQVFTQRGIELNTVIRFNNAALAHDMLRAGVGMMLMREEFALQGEADGYLSLSPLAHAQMPLAIIHLSSRAVDPLIRAFLDSAGDVWPSMKPGAS